ncbi:MAG: dTMP kinase [bacterium]
MRGLLITFEGVEGSGKSTQAQQLVEYLREKGMKVIFLRDPGGTAIGERVRELLLDPKVAGMDGRTELFLYLASRNQLVREKILPGINNGNIVVCDRFADSSVVYQGYGRQLGERLILRLNKLASSGLKPDLTILIDLPVAVGYQRKGKEKLDRVEQEKIQFHLRVRDGYLRLARRAAGRIKLVNGNRSPDEIQTEIRSLVSRFLERKGVLRK